MVGKNWSEKLFSTFPQIKVFDKANFNYMVEITFVRNLLQDWKGKTLKTLASALTVTSVQEDLNMQISQKVLTWNEKY